MSTACCLAMLRHWSAHPIRSVALGALIALLAMGGSLACWLHCHRHASMLAHGSHAGHRHVQAAITTQTLQHPNRYPALVSDAPGHRVAVEAPACMPLHDSPTALTIGVLLLPLLLVMLHSRRWHCAPAALVVRHRTVPPRHPPPRLLSALAA